jgi:hypothetical protein
MNDSSSSTTPPLRPSIFLLAAEMVANGEVIWSCTAIVVAADVLRLSGGGELQWYKENILPTTLGPSSWDIATLDGYMINKENDLRGYDADYMRGLRILLLSLAAAIAADM